MGPGPLSLMWSWGGLCAASRPCLPSHATPRHISISISPARLSCLFALRSHAAPFFFFFFVFCAGAIVRGLYRRPRYSALILAQHQSPIPPLVGVIWQSVLCPDRIKVLVLYCIVRTYRALLLLFDANLSAPNTSLYQQPEVFLLASLAATLRTLQTTSLSSVPRPLDHLTANFLASHLPPCHLRYK